MRQRYQEPRIGNRRWIAWKLVQLAYRIYDPNYWQRIYINDAEGKKLFEAEIIGDLYGCGVFSMFGANPWDDTLELPGAAILHYEDEYEPDWLED